MPEADCETLIAPEARASVATVVIPTYNRAAHLLETLRHLERQSRPDFDVIVVDDGSGDDTQARVRAFANGSPLSLQLLAQPNGGPARARNRGIAAARGPLVIMIGDDTYPHPDLVAAHVDFHERHPAFEQAALGWTKWHQQGAVTPFMRWLDTHGVQFNYGELLAGGQASWRHFYTSNLSLKTAYLRQHRFNERFRGAAWEDIELGFRMEAEAGLRISFLPEAVTHHDHPIGVRGACRRMTGVGHARWIAAELWPQQFGMDARGWRSAGRRLLGTPFLRQALAWMAELVASRRCPHRFIDLALAVHHELGYRQAAQAARARAKLR